MRYFDAQISTATASNPEIQIEQIPLQWSEGRTKLLLAHSSSQEPDITHIGIEWAQEFINAKVFMPLIVDDTGIPKQFHEVIKVSLFFLKNKSKSLEDIYNNSKYIFSYELKEDQLQKIDKSKLTIIKNIYSIIKKDKNISKDYLKNIFDKIIETEKINFKDLGQPLRIILTGSEYGPAIYDIASSLGLNEFLNRLELFFSKIDKNIKN